MIAFFSNTVSRLMGWFKFRPRLDIDIMIDVLESEIDHDELKELFDLDLTKDESIRKILPNRLYHRYVRLNLYSDKRKALLVLFNSMKLEKKLKEMLLKTMFYPLFLFGISFIMLMFVDGLLLKTFQSLLSFMGPDMSIKWYQTILKSMIILDTSILMFCIAAVILINKRKIQMYRFSTKLRPLNQWTRLLSHQFCQKFLHFYKLGESLDRILAQIQWSSDEVLALCCSQIITDLEEGKPLSSAINRVDPKLAIYFKMSEEGMEIEKYLENHTRIQELMLTKQIKSLGRTILAYAYIKIAVIIIVIYQMMLKPIEMMENYL